MSIRQLARPSAYGMEVVGNIAEILEITLQREYITDFDEEPPATGFRDNFRVRMNVWVGGSDAAQGAQPVEYTVNVRQGEIGAPPITQEQYDAIRAIAYDVVMTDDPGYADGTVVMD